MAFLLNEEIVETIVTQVNEANPAYQFDWRTYALGSIQEGRTATAVIFLENASHFALIHLGMFDVSKATDVDYIEKSEIQGLRIRKGMINTILKIRLHNGQFFKILFNSKGGKKLPLHKENVPRYRERFEREYATQRDIKDRNSGLFLKLWTVFCWIIAFVMTVVVVVLTESRLLGILTFIGTGMGLSWLGGRFEMESAKHKDKAFFKEVEALTAQYAETDQELYYEKLKNLQNLPQTEIYQAQYYQMLVALAYDLDRLEEAHNHLKLFPRRYSEGAEDMYQGLVNLLAMPKPAVEEEVAKESILPAENETVEPTVTEKPETEEE